MQTVSRPIMARTRLARVNRAVPLLLQESRIPVQVIFLLRFLSVAALASGLPSASRAVLLPAAAWGLATVAVYVFNGVMDVAEDRVNGSSRPIASGALDTGTAVAGAAGAAAAALLLALLSSGGAAALLVALYLGCGYAYSGPPFHGKRSGSSASLLVLGLGLLTYAAGWQASGHLHPLPVLLLASAMSLWMAGVGAFAKDLSDVAGDRVGGRRTPVIAWGETRVRLVVAVDALAIGVLYLLAAAAWVPVLLPSAVLVAAGGAAVALLAFTTRRSTAKRERRPPYWAFMVTQYAAHLVLLSALTIWRAG